MHMGNGAVVGGFTHEAFFYRDLDEYVDGLRDFVWSAIDKDEQVLVAVPEARTELLRQGLAAVAQSVTFLEPGEIGPNPAKAIPLIRGFIDEQRGRRIRFVGELIWAGRRWCETVEATRHEALVNLAFADTAATILCPYDASSLDPRVLADAERTHPIVVCGHDFLPSPNYTDPEVVYAAGDLPLPPPVLPVASLPVTTDLAGLRRFTATHAGRAKLSAERLADLLLAVTEAATNSLRYTARPGVLRVWCDEDDLVCEIADSGHIDDPLAGRRRPDKELPNGRGLWLINQLCDLVQLRASDSGTTLRLHMTLR